MLDSVFFEEIKRRILLFGVLLSALFAACGQKVTNTESCEPTDSIDTETTPPEEPVIGGTDEDEPEYVLVTYEDNERFVKSLAEHPEMMNWSAWTFYDKYRVNADESDDKRLRIYSWYFDNGQGGRYCNYTRQAYQYRGVSGVHTVGDYLASLFPDDDYPFLDGNTYVGEIMTFCLLDGGKLYIVPYHVVAAGGLTIYSFCAVTIQGDEMKPVAVFPLGNEKEMARVLIREIDFLNRGQGDWEDPYFVRRNELWVKTESVDNSLFDVYRFNGESFEYLGEEPAS